MNKEQYITRAMDSDNRVRDNINNSYISAQMSNITQMRSLIIHYITISSGVIGFSIPIFGNTNLINSQTYFFGGLAELVIVIFYGFYYLTHTLQVENNALSNGYGKIIAWLDKKQEARNKFLSSAMTDEAMLEWIQREKKLVIESKDEKSTNKPKPDYSPDILFTAFVVGLILITLSMIDPGGIKV